MGTVIAACAAALATLTPAWAVDRVRVDADNNVVTAFGTPIRGVPFFLDVFAVADFLDGMWSTSPPTRRISAKRCATTR